MERGKIFVRSFHEINLENVAFTVYILITGYFVFIYVFLFLCQNVFTSQIRYWLKFFYQNAAGIHMVKQWLTNISRQLPKEGAALELLVEQLQYTILTYNPIETTFFWYLDQNI